MVYLTGGDGCTGQVLLSRMQMVQCVVLGIVWLLRLSDMLAVWHVYVAIAALTGARRLGR
jgi:hypothetical protein